MADLATSLSPPVFLSSTFRLSSVEEGARFAEEHHPDAFYTRWGNPTTRVFERAVAELEGAEDALATSSGMGAISCALVTATRGGGHVVAGKTLYAATSEMFSRYLPDQGVTTTFVDPADPTSFRDAIRDDTRLIYVETPANPTLDITDLEAVAAVARERGVPWIADNTFATPWHQNPIGLGATAVMHSATKYLGGHTDITAGILAGSREFVERAWYALKLFGPTLGPFDAWLAIRGIRTFPLRMERHAANAARLAAWLEAHPAVERVYYPGLASHPGHEVAARIMRRGFGGMLSVELAGGFEAGRRFVENVRVAVLAVSLGGVETLVEHPASMTHGPLTPEERSAAGISDGLVRISVGIEDAGDLERDFDRALGGGGARRSGAGDREAPSSAAPLPRASKE